jgi:17beta-estradiol 17-dehydrogenase/3alpha(17beta)-hydroxysteroid dehydrogenase (NAD+)
MTKAGIDGFTKSIAKELGAYRIRANSVLPYFIDTPMVATSKMEPGVLNVLENMTALKRLGKPEEVAEVILFLASDTSSYVNGASIDITGGL